MDVLTFEACWAVNSEKIKQVVTSSWPLFTQLSSTCLSLTFTTSLVGVARFVVGHCTALHPPSYRPPLDLIDGRFLNLPPRSLLRSDLDALGTLWLSFTASVNLLCQFPCNYVYNFKQRFLFLTTVYALSVCVIYLFTLCSTNWCRWNISLT